MDIIGTVLAVEAKGGRTTLTVSCGSNGSSRRERVLIKGEHEVPAGSPIRGSGLERIKDGTLVAAQGARIALAKKTRKQAPKTTTPVLAAAYAHLLPQVDPSARALLEHGLTEEQVAILQGYTPAKFLQVRKIHGGDIVTFVDNHYVTAALNFVFGHTWDEEYDAPLIEGSHAATRCRLTVRFPDGATATRTATGGHPIAKYTTGKNAGEVIDLGNAIKAAEADALKKAASKLGIAWDVYAGVTVHPEATKGAKRIYQVVEARPAPPTTVTPPESSPVASAASVTAVASPPQPVGATPEQLAAALRLFEGDLDAILAAATSCGVQVSRVEEIPLPVLKRIAEKRAAERKEERIRAVTESGTAAKAA